MVYHATANMYRIVCKMGIASIQGHGTSAYLPRRRNLHFFFPFFFITVLLSRPSHHTGTQDLCSLVYNSSMKNSMLITDHPRSKYILSPPYLFFFTNPWDHSPRTPIFRFSGLLAYGLSPAREIAKFHNPKSKKFLPFLRDR